MASGLLACAALGACITARAADVHAGVSEAQYAEFMENEALDLKDLAEGAEIQRRFFNYITPPDVSLNQPMFPPVVPFTATNFADAFLDSLLGEDTNSVATYPLSLVLDPMTRETLIYNAEGKLIAVIPANPAPGIPPEGSDPSRVTLLLNLLPSEDVEPYLYVESRIAEFAVSAVKTAKTGGVGMKSLGSADFGICDIQKLTNGNMKLVVTNGTDVAEIYAYTVAHTSSVTTNTWGGTNTSIDTLWQPVSPPFNGLESMWECRETNLVLTNGAGVWEDSNISGNARVRFYGVANRMDSDDDGLTDGGELFVHHTGSTNADTDGDGMGDGDEVNLTFDPLTPDDYVAVWIASPAGGRP
jgi:hypothetical protein